MQQQPSQPPAPHSPSDDINIPLVAVTVAFFAAFLAVVIVGLQAYVYNYQAAELVAKTPTQDDPSTDLGAFLEAQRHELRVAGRPRPPAVAAAGTSASAASQSTSYRIPIDRAMDKIVSEYSSRQAGRP